MSSHTTNSYRADDKHSYTVLHFTCIGMTPSAAFVDASGLVGDTKRLRLPRFDCYLSVSDDLESPSLRLILHPIVYPPTQKLYINQSTEGTAVCELMVLGMQSQLTIQHSANASCCIALSTTPLVPLVHVQHSPSCFNYYVIVNS